jgi:hypothetical protein
MSLKGFLAVGLAGGLLLSGCGNDELSYGGSSGSAVAPTAQAPVSSSAPFTLTLDPDPLILVQGGPDVLLAPNARFTVPDGVVLQDVVITVTASEGLRVIVPPGLKNVRVTGPVPAEAGGTTLILSTGLTIGAGIATNPAAVAAVINGLIHSNPGLGLAVGPGSVSITVSDSAGRRSETAVRQVNVVSSASAR